MGQSETDLSFKASGFSFSSFFSSSSMVRGDDGPEGSSARILCGSSRLIGRAGGHPCATCLSHRHHQGLSLIQDPMRSQTHCGRPHPVTSGHHYRCKRLWDRDRGPHGRDLLDAFGGASRQCYAAWPEHRFTLPATGETVGEFKEAIQALFWLRNKLKEASAHVQVVGVN